MWFTDIASWSQKKLKAYRFFYGLLYYAFALFIPCIIVSIKYDLIKSSSIRLTGVGIIFFMVIVIFLFKGVKKFLLKLPQEDLKEQRLKFFVLMLFNLILPALTLWLIYLIKQNVILACDTLTKCISSFICSIIIDYMTLEFLEVEKDFRQEARHQVEVNKRINTITK